MPHPSTALLESLSLWLLTVLGGFLLSRSGFTAWEKSAFSAPFLTTALLFTVLPLVFLLLKRRDLGRAGLHFALPQVEVGFTALAVAGPISGLAFPLVAALHHDPLDWQGGLVLAGAYALALPLTAYVVRNIKTRVPDEVPAWHLVGLLLVMVAALALAALLKTSAPRLTSVLYALCSLSGCPRSSSSGVTCNPA